MKNNLLLIAFLAGTLLLVNCNPSRRAAGRVPKIKYETQLLETIAANCSPCHFPSKGGNKKPLDNYASVKTNIDEIIKRIVLNPSDKGFMPFKKAKLSDSTIAIFKKWVNDGLIEK